MMLEFELDKSSLDGTFGVYNVRRKGMKVGIIIITKPYNEVELEEYDIMIKGSKGR